MWWWLNPRKPYGVRMLHQDGTVMPCRVVRDRARDHGGNAYWLAVPRTPPPVLADGDGWGFTCRRLPSHTILGFDISVSLPADAGPASR